MAAAFPPFRLLGTSEKTGNCKSHKPFRPLALHPHPAGSTTGLSPGAAPSSAAQTTASSSSSSARSLSAAQLCFAQPHFGSFVLLSTQSPAHPRWSRGRGGFPHAACSPLGCSQGQSQLHIEPTHRNQAAAAVAAAADSPAAAGRPSFAPFPGSQLMVGAAAASAPVHVLVEELLTPGRPTPFPSANCRKKLSLANISLVRISAAAAPACNP